MYDLLSSLVISLMQVYISICIHCYEYF